MLPFPSNRGVVERSLLLTTASDEEDSTGAIREAAVVRDDECKNAEVVAEGRGTHEIDPLMRRSCGEAFKSLERAILTG